MLNQSSAACVCKDKSAGKFAVRFAKSSVHFEPYFCRYRLNLSGKFGKTTFPLNLLDKFVKFKPPSTKKGKRVGKFKKSRERR
jgi:hypothetical protein